MLFIFIRFCFPTFGFSTFVDVVCCCGSASGGVDCVKNWTAHSTIFSFPARCQRLSFAHMLCVYTHVQNRHNEILNNSSAWILSHGESEGDENKRKTSAPERVTLKVNFVINYQEIDYRVCVVGYFQSSVSYFSLSRAWSQWTQQSFSFI